jgi:hypothetical protein
MAASAAPLMAKPDPFVFSTSMTPVNPHLLPEEKLAILQAADAHRKWHSLDDQRVCVLCDKTITGRQIEIIPGSGGGYSLRCPTENCPSTPGDWFYRGAAVKKAVQRSVEVDLW